MKKTWKNTSHIKQEAHIQYFVMVLISFCGVWSVFHCEVDMPKNLCNQLQPLKALPESGSPTQFMSPKFRCGQVKRSSKTCLKLIFYILLWNYFFFLVFFHNLGHLVFVVCFIVVIGFVPLFLVLHLHSKSTFVSEPLLSTWPVLPACSFLPTSLCLSLIGNCKQ